MSERRSSFGELPLGPLMRAQGITAGVLPLADAFDRFDGNGSGGIDVGELRSALQYLGVSCSPAQADVLLKQYDNYPDDTLDIKEFATIVRDVKLLLEFDSDGDGQLNLDELQPALESLGVSIENVQMEKIMRRFDVDNSGTIDLVELNSLIRTVQAFVKYDTDGSGTIDIEELRGALRRLGLRAGSLGAADVFRRYDADESGVIELHEFAVLARDLQLYANFDSDCNGLIDEGELHLVLQKLGMHTTLAETRKVLRAWDTAATGTLDLPNFSQLVADVRTFRDFDLDFDGKLNEPELRSALRSLGVDLADLASTLTKHQVAAGSGLIELTQFAGVVRDLTRNVPRDKSADDGLSLTVLPQSAPIESKFTGEGAATAEELRVQAEVDEMQATMLYA